MTIHAEDALTGARIAQVLDLALAVPTSETGGAKGLVAGEDGEVFDLVAAGVAAICTVVADEGAVAEEEEVCIGVKEGSACVTSEAVNVPSVAGCGLSSAMDGQTAAPKESSEGGRAGHDWSLTYLAQRPCLPQVSVVDGQRRSLGHEQSGTTHLSTALAWEDSIGLVEW